MKIASHVFIVIADIVAVVNASHLIIAQEMEIFLKTAIVRIVNHAIVTMVDVVVTITLVTLTAVVVKTTALATVVAPAAMDVTIIYFSIPMKRRVKFWKVD